MVACPDRLPKEDELQGQIGFYPVWIKSGLLNLVGTEDAQLSGQPTPNT